MADESDKYPESSGRRRFVKGVVGSASLVAVGAAGAVGIDSATSPTGAGGGTTQFYGMENVDGPAPRAMPMIPIEVDDNGDIRGVYPEIQEVEQNGQTVEVARMEVGGVTYSVDWFQYCGVQGYGGIQPSYEGDNYFRYSGGPNAFDWHADRGGERININDFEDYETWGNDIGTAGIGKPAIGTWRSQDTESTIPIQIIRSTRVQQAIDQASGDLANWLQAATTDGLIANLNKCTHFCCIPTFKGSAQSIQFDAANQIYCGCHQSVYDPYSIVRKTFVALPRPEE